MDVAQEIQSLKGLMVSVERSLRKSRQQSPAQAARHALIKGIVVTFVKVARGNRGGTVFDVARSLYPGNAVLAKSFGDNGQYRAAVDPAMTSVPAWGGELIGETVVSNLLLLTPISVAAKLAARGLQLPENGRIILPTSKPSDIPPAVFGVEGAAIPARKSILSSLSLTPKRAGLLAVFTNELSRRSTPAIEAIIGQMLAVDLARGIDAVLLDASPATAWRPAGLLNGATEVSASDNTDPAAAMVEDISNLVAAIAVPGGPVDPVVIVNSKQAASASLYYPGGASVISSDLLAVGTVIALDASSFILAGSPESFSVEGSSHALNRRVLDEHRSMLESFAQRTVSYARQDDTMTLAAMSRRLDAMAMQVAKLQLDIDELKQGR
ncbi:phage major capsid protein [Rhizobium sp. PL01]|uniref:phage major capsid protein n=1 Tax=Rhizobium sp. PL01 TaxID=3085631 RepID=UPI002982391C|nr:phage major capsid protein [Rhizobium sp. PL01]MDW5313353.1 hypothetical protein [Rhizobium sp. PL01]